MEKDRIQRGLDSLGAAIDGKFLTHLNACVHCGLCASSCLYYQSDQAVRNIPATKVDVVASVYRRYFTFLGRTFPWLRNSRELDDATLAEMTDLLFGSCTLCGRCNKHCSIGVDIEYIVRRGRSMLAAMGYVPQTLQKTVDAAIQTGNNMAIPVEEFVGTLQWLEEDLRMELNDDTASIPVDEPGKQVLYTLNPREPKFFPLSISAMAKVFHKAGESWALSTRMYDVTNYAYFSGNEAEAETIAQRLAAEMQAMGSRRCVLAECGHGSRAFRWEGPNYMKQGFNFEVLTSVELLADYIREGRISVDAGKITDRVTLHDPCNLVRSGGIIDEQRYILKHCVSDFVEMTPHGADNHCCGGGGGQLAMSEYNERRMKAGSIKAEQIRKTGARIVVTPCHNCVDQLTQINVYYKLGVKIMTMAEVVADAIADA